jgi:hypothetical protein
MFSAFNKKNNPSGTPELRRSARELGLPPEFDGLPEASSHGKFNSSNFYGRLGESENIVPIVTSSNPSETSSNLASTLRQEFRKRDDFLTPSKTTIKEVTPNGSPKVLETQTARKRTFVRCILTEIAQKQSDDAVQVRLYQTAESAAYGKKLAIIKVDPEEIQETIERPVSQTFEAKVVITRDILEDASTLKREKSHNERATDVGNAFGKSGTFEHSHGIARRHGQFPMHPVFTEDQKSQPNSSQSYITVPAPKEHNSMRLPTIENTEVNKIIQRNGQLQLCNKVKFATDENNQPVPVMESESSSWNDGENSIQFNYDPYNGVTPAMGIDHYTKIMYQTTFPRKRKDAPEESIHAAKRPRFGTG